MVNEQMRERVQMIRERTKNEAVEVDTAQDKHGRKWVKEFPQYLKLKGKSATPPDDTVEVRYILRYANGKAEYVLDAVDSDAAYVRLAYATMDVDRPELDDDGVVKLPEDVVTPPVTEATDVLVSSKGKPL